MKKTVLILVAALIVIGAVGYWFTHRFEQTTDDATIESTVVTISPKVSGYIKALNVSDNQMVKAGDVLLEIDPTDYQIKLDRAKANLDSAKAQLQASGETLESTKVSAPSNLEAIQAQVAAAQANWENASKKLKRLQNLNDLSRSRQQLDDAVAEEHSTLSTLNDAKARLRSAETAPRTVAAAVASNSSLEALVKLAEADVAAAQSDLDHTKIVAPIDGRIANKGIEKGDYLQPGQTLFSLVGTDFWVVANYKETQITDMKAGQLVDVEIDALPGRHLSAKIDSLQSGTGARFSAFPPQNATGNFVKIVQRVPVKITFTNPDEVKTLPLGPGMSVLPKVYTK